jgi:para-nitrobenzyl esterase
MWIHGGGNVGGGTKWQDASGLAAEGIVVVTVAYRLGAMGFLELAELFNAHFKSSGNNGIRDLVQALHWIRESIAAFGGDPSRVTIAGQSAGAKNVAALLAAPSAQGLFHGAISLSGSGMTVHSRKEAHRVARLLAQELGDPLDLLRRSGREIMTAQGRLGAKYDQAYPFRPVYETLFLPDLPVNLVRGRVPLLLGTCRDESVGFLSGGDEDRPIRSREIANVPFERIPPMETRYSQAFPDLPALDRRVRLVSAEEYWIPSVRLAEAHSARGGQTWMYRFDHLGRTVQTPRDAFVGHGADMDAFWNRRAGFSLHETVVQFIHGRAPDWPTYSTFARNVMLFGEGGRMEVAVDPRGEERVLWNEAIP